MEDPGVGFEVDPASAAEVDDYLYGVRDRILNGIRGGMQEAMELLAGTAADNVQSLTSQTRQGPGGLVAALLQSPRVWENATAIGGFVSGYVPNKGDVALWLERGTSVPALQGANGKLYGFYEAGGESVFTHGHRAFKVAPHPFMSTALDQDRSMIFEIIQQRVADAVAA